MPLLWNFRCYVSEDGMDEIRRSYDRVGKQGRAKFQSKLFTLAHLPFEDWREPLYKALHGDGAGLGEIRFLANKVQQRPIGFRSGRYEFTLLLWATERSNRFVPSNACEKAQERKIEAQATRERTHVLWLALE